MKEIIRMAEIGSGWAARLLCEDISAAENIKVAKVFSRSLDKARTFAAKYKIDNACNDLDEILNDPEIEAVHIATTNESHKPLALKCIEAKKHVLVEKPFALNAKEAKSIFDAAEKNDVFVMDAI